MNQRNNYPKEAVISILKEWASPVLIGIVGMLLWRDVTEMRADVKLLLTQQSADRVKIEQLETDVAMLKNFVFAQSSSKPQGNNPPVLAQFYPALIQKEEDLSGNPPKKEER